MRSPVWLARSCTRRIISGTSAIGTATSSAKKFFGIAIRILPKDRRASHSLSRSTDDCAIRLSAPSSTSTMRIRSSCTNSSSFPSCSTISTASRCGSKPDGSLSRTNSSEPRSRISIAAGKWPAARDRATAKPASSRVVKPTMAAARYRGSGTSLTITSVTMPRVPSEPTNSCSSR